MSSLTRNRLWWLATCAIFVACASAPAPKSTKKKKKKKKRDSIALKKKKDADRNEDDKADEKPDKPAKKAKDDESAASDDDVVVVDDDGESEPAAKKKSKKDKEAEAAAEKKRKKEEAAEAAAEKKRQKEEAAAAAAAEKKRKQEEEAAAAEEAAAKKKKKKAKQEEEEVAEEEPPPDEEEAKPKKGKKPEKVAAKSKKAKKQAEEEEEIAEEPPPEAEPEEPKPVKKKPDKKKKPEQVAAIDMTGAEPTPTDEPVIDMEDSGGSSLDKRVDDEPPAGRVAAIPVPGVDDDSDEQSVTAEATPGTPNPLSINDRPLTLPDGKLSVHGGLRVGVITVQPAGGAAVSSTATGFALGATYGLGPKSEVGFDYTLGVSPGSAKGPFTLHGAYTAVSGGKLDLAIATALAVDPTDLVDPTTMMSTSNTYVSLQIGAWARYRLTRKASLFSGLPALPTSAVSLTKNALSLPPQPYQVVIGLNNTGTIALDIPVGVGYQINPKIYAFGVLELAHIRIANTVNAFIFDRFIPISLGGFYSLDKLDIGATFTDDLKQGTDYLRFDTFVRYSIK